MFLKHLDDCCIYIRICLSLRSATWRAAPASVTGSSFLTSSEQSPVIFTKHGPWHGWPYASTGLGLEL